MSSTVIADMRRVLDIFEHYQNKTWREHHINKRTYGERDAGINSASNLIVDLMSCPEFKEALKDFNND